jgi:4'-phosphopantetheinyl transferase
MRGGKARKKIKFAFFIPENMPVEFIREITKNQKLGLWKIEESKEQMLKELLLSEAARNQYQSISSEKRKHYWLATRLLLNEIIGKNQEIKYDEYGGPFIDSETKISISHSGEYAAIITDQINETGIDIELIKPKIFDLVPKFLSNQELNDIKGSGPEKACVYWCAKEAMYKMYRKKQLEFRRNLLIDPFQYSEKGEIKGRIIKDNVENIVSLVYEKTGAYILVYVLND